MTCEACDEARRIDEVTPDCETDKGCLIPPLDETGQRIIEIHARIGSLNGLVDAATVLRMYEATTEDLAMLALVKEALTEARSNEGSNGNDGNA